MLLWRSYLCVMMTLSANIRCLWFDYCVNPINWIWLAEFRTGAIWGVGYADSSVVLDIISSSWVRFDFLLFHEFCSFLVSFWYFYNCIHALGKIWCNITFIPKAMKKNWDELYHWHFRSIHVLRSQHNQSTIFLHICDWFIRIIPINLIRTCQMTV